MTANRGKSTGKNLGVLISGRGTNLQSIIDAIAAGRLDASIAVVISNREDAPGLERAASAGIETLVLDHRAHTSREDYDTALVAALGERGVGVVCLAGFMRVLSPVFIRAFPNRILNIHPALLPSFPGVNAQHQAWAHGVKVTGATAHLVDDTLDGGPIVLQEAIEVLDDDTPETLASRILEIEHRLYPRAIDDVLRGGWRIEGRRFVR
ncbi:MAG: phosphoribosylglycinamide formyltransferase [Acidobacteriota bacterium]|nr:phosphoribosylglycinamide formyltransferase [Acidobacteriota bacterium]